MLLNSWRRVQFSRDINLHTLRLLLGILLSPNAQEGKNTSLVGQITVITNLLVSVYATELLEGRLTRHS